MEVDNYTPEDVIKAKILLAKVEEKEKIKDKEDKGVINEIMNDSSKIMQFS